MDGLLSAFFTFAFVMMATFRLAKTPVEAWGGFALAVFGALAMVFGQSVALWLLAGGALVVAWMRGVALTPQRRFLQKRKKGQPAPQDTGPSVFSAIRDGWHEGWRSGTPSQALVVRDGLTPTEAHLSLVSDSARLNPFRPEGPQGRRPVADGARLSSDTMAPVGTNEGQGRDRHASLPDGGAVAQGMPAAVLPDPVVATSFLPPSDATPHGPIPASSPLPTEHTA